MSACPDRMTLSRNVPPGRPAGCGGSTTCCTQPEEGGHPAATCLMPVKDGWYSICTNTTAEGQGIAYTVAIKTADDPEAGTDAWMWLTLKVDEGVATGLAWG